MADRAARTPLAGMPSWLSLHNAEPIELGCTRTAQDMRTAGTQNPDDCTPSAQSSLRRMGAVVSDSLNHPIERVVPPLPGRSVLACGCGVMLDLADLRRPRQPRESQQAAGHGIRIEPICCQRCADGLQR